MIKGFINTDPLLGQFGHKTVVHAGPIRNVRGQNPLDQDMLPIEASSMIKKESIRNTNIDEITFFLYSLAQDIMNTMGREFFKGITEVTKATGQVVDAKGEPLSLDHVLDTLEKISLEFDKDGKPIMPQIILPPEMFERFRKLKESDDQRKRLEKIIINKREEYYAKQRTRRLS